MSDQQQPVEVVTADTMVEAINAARSQLSALYDKGGGPIDRYEIADAAVRAAAKILTSSKDKLIEELEGKLAAAREAIEAHGKMWDHADEAREEEKRRAVRAEERFVEEKRRADQAAAITHQLRGEFEREHLRAESAEHRLAGAREALGHLIGRLRTETFSATQASGLATDFEAICKLHLATLDTSEQGEEAASEGSGAASELDKEAEGECIEAAVNAKLAEMGIERPSDDEIAERRNDPAYRARLKRSIEENRELLERLGDPGTTTTSPSEDSGGDGS